MIFHSFKHNRVFIKLSICTVLGIFSAFTHAQTVNIQKRNTDFSIDGNNGGIQGQQVYLWENNNNNVNQQWVQVDRGNGFFSFQKNNTNMCLDGGNGGARGQAVTLQSCSSSNRNQQWRKVAASGGSFRLEKSNEPNFSIDGNRGAQARQSIYLWNSDNNNVNQQWAFTNLDQNNPTPPSNTSNCTGEFELPDCVERAANNGGGTVVLTDRTYRLTESLRLRDNVNIVGQGKNTIIRFANNVANTVDEPLMLGLGVDNIELKDFTLRCAINQSPRSNDIRNDHMGIYMDGSGDPSKGESTNNNNVRMERIEAYYCSNGMHLKGLTGFIGIDLDLHDNGNTEVDLFHNIYLRRVADIHMSQTSNNSGGFYASNRGHGLRLSHIADAYFGNLAVYDNADHGVHLTDGVFDVRFHNLRNTNNCANSSGACGEFRCYGSSENCDINRNAVEERQP